MVKAYQPKVEVTLIKVVQRDKNRTKNATGQRAVIDLTPYLSEGNTVQFSRGINQPAGVFSVNFPDVATPHAGDSIYSLVELMDVIEIRMAREPHEYADSLPVVFRGFVSSIKRDEKMGNDGKPHRQVIISGRDWGGMLQAIQIFYAKNYAVGDIMLSSFPMFYAYGVKFENLKPSSFVYEIVDKIVNQWIDEFWLGSDLEQGLRLNVKATVTQGRVSPYGFGSFEGNIWNLLTQWTDLAWNELIFDDTDSGSHLIYRAKPYRGIKEMPLIMEDAVEPDTVELGIDAVVSLNAERNIESVFNFFHVSTPQANLNKPDLINVQSMQKGLVYVTDEENIDPAIYGLRKLTESSSMTHEDNPTGVDGLQTPDQKKFAERHNLWLETRRDELVEMRKDASLFESGSMTLRGNERIKPGVYLNLNRGDLQAEYYINNVSHVFEVLGAYTTEVQFIRGTGFAERLETPNYSNETSQGVYE